MSKSESELKYLLPNEILISSQSFLLESITKLSTRLLWNIGNYLQAAEDLGAMLMYEPLRGIWSTAREELTQSQSSGIGIGMIAEPARTETHLFDYELRLRGLYQLLYLFLQQHRFTDETIVFLKELQRAISTPEKPVPVRVYQPKHGYHSAIQEEALKYKIYAQDTGAIIVGILGAIKEVDERKIVKRLVQAVVEDVAQYQVSGIELNVLSLIKVFQDHQELIHPFLELLLSQSNPDDPMLALVQTIAVQTNRIDLQEEKELKAITDILEMIKALGFSGGIVYAPGGKSNKKKEIAFLKQVFPGH